MVVAQLLHQQALNVQKILGLQAQVYQITFTPLKSCWQSGVQTNVFHVLSKDLSHFFWPYSYIFIIHDKMNPLEYLKWQLPQHLLGALVHDLLACQDAWSNSHFRSHKFRVKDACYRRVSKYPQYKLQDHPDKINRQEHLPHIILTNS